MSTAQHTVVQSGELKEKIGKEWRRPEGKFVDDLTRLLSDLYKGEHILEDLQKTTFTEARAWKEDEGATLYVNGAGDRLVRPKHKNLLACSWCLRFTRMRRIQYLI